VESSLGYMRRFSLCNCLTVHEPGTYTAHGMTLDLFLREARPGIRLPMPHTDKWPSGYVRVFKIPARIRTFMLSPFNEAYHPCYRFPGFPALYTMGPHEGTAWLKAHAVEVPRPTPEEWAEAAFEVAKKVERIWGNVTRVLVIYDRRRAPEEVRERVLEYDRIARKVFPRWPVVRVDGPEKPNPEAMWCHYTKEARSAVTEAVGRIEQAGTGRWPPVRVATARNTDLERALLKHDVVVEAEVARGGQVVGAGPNTDLVWASKSTRAFTTRQAVDAVRTRNPGAKLVFWDGDVRERVPDHIKVHGGEIDVLLVGHEDYEAGDKLYKKWARDLGTFYHGVDPANFPAPRGPGKGVFFGGSNYLGRDDEYPLSEFRAELVEAFHRSGMEFDVLGHYWSAGKLWAPVQDPLGYCKVMQRAAITLGTNHFDLTRYYTKRLFDSLAAGRLHLTRYIPGMESDLGNHRELVWFRSVDEALDLAAWYLAHDEERERVAERGREWVMAGHTVDHRAHKLAMGFRHITGKEFGHAG